MPAFCAFRFSAFAFCASAFCVLRSALVVLAFSLSSEPCIINSLRRTYYAPACGVVRYGAVQCCALRASAGLELGLEPLRFRCATGGVK